MDSLTQATLGAAVGEAVLGKKTGNKAAVIGAIIGTIPDLDVLLVPFSMSFKKSVCIEGIVIQYCFVCSEHFYLLMY